MIPDMNDWQMGYHENQVVDFFSSCSFPFHRRHWLLYYTMVVMVVDQQRIGWVCIKFGASLIDHFYLHQLAMFRFWTSGQKCWPWQNRTNLCKVDARCCGFVPISGRFRVVLIFLGRTLPALKYPKQKKIKTGSKIFLIQQRMALIQIMDLPRFACLRRSSLLLHWRRINRRSSRDFVPHCISHFIITIG